MKMTLRIWFKLSCFCLSFCLSKCLQNFQQNNKDELKLTLSESRRNYFDASRSCYHDYGGRLASYDNQNKWKGFRKQHLVEKTCSDTCEPFYVAVYDEGNHLSDYKRFVPKDTKLKPKLVSKCKVLQGVKPYARNINVSLHIFPVNCNLPAKYVCEPSIAEQKRNKVNSTLKPEERKNLLVNTTGMMSNLTSNISESLKREKVAVDGSDWPGNIKIFFNILIFIAVFLISVILGGFVYKEICSEDFLRKFNSKSYFVTESSTGHRNLPTPVGD